MAASEARHRISLFLEQQLFQPVHDEDPDRHPPFRRGDVEDVRRRVAYEWEHIQDATSAGGMLTAFREAAARSAVTGLDEKLSGLGMSNFAAIATELEKLAAELGVTIKQPAHH